MVKIIGVRFRNVGKIYYFNPKSFQMKPGDHVIVETARGVEYGTVVLGPKEVDDRQVVQPLKDVIRMATQKDDAKEESNRKKEKEAYHVCVKKIRAHQLEMKLIDVEYTFDNNKILFYFTADGRIDFRELVKDLAAIFKTRIELRQIGVRDETKILGGIGICGRPLCCHTYLSEFAPVSIKMAKEQNLSLNPTKISGVCGRLMCCLKNEQETYEYLNKQLPNIGDQVMTPEGIKGEVQSVNVLRQLVKVIMDVNDEKEIREYKVEELKFRSRGCCRKEKMKLSKEEQKILMEAKTDGKYFTGLEIQEQSAEMAGRSVVYNHLEDAITIRTGDIKEATAIFGRASFSVVTCNPPYMHGNHGLTNPHLPKAIARHEVLCTLEDVISQTAQLLKPRGRFYMVHRPFRLAEIMGLMMQYKLEPKRMRLVYPYVDREPNMVLIEGLLGGNSRITVEKPLIVYEKPGVYTQEIREIYGDGR